MAGVKGKSGRGGVGLDRKIKHLKERLLSAIENDIDENPKRALFWAEKFANRLMPQQVEGTEEGGAITVKVVSYGQKDFLSSTLQLGSGISPSSDSSASGEVQDNSISS